MNKSKVKRIKKQIKKRMKYWRGPRCKHEYIGCPCCKAREKYDALFGKE